MAWAWKSLSGWWRREARSRRDESLRLLAEHGGDAIFRFGPDGKARYVSPAAERLFGCPVSEIYARCGNVSRNAFLHEEDQPMVADAVRGHFSGELPETVLEFRIRGADGGIRWVETNCSTIRDSATGEATDIVFIMRNITRWKRDRERLERQALSDTLTGLCNRRAFDAALERAWRRARRRRHQLSLIMADIDWFKTLNDSLGHQAGDACLEAVARSIADAARHPADFAARYGGEEFAIILPETGRRDASMVAARMCETVSALALPHPGHPSGHVTISAGAATALASAGGAGAGPADLVHLADQALYAAKAGGRNRVETALLAAPAEGLRATG